MIYEEKKAIRIQSIIEADKLKYTGRHPTLYLHKSSLNKIDKADIRNIILQFEQLEKIIIGNYTEEFKFMNKPIDFPGSNEPFIELTFIDLKYFQDEFQNYKSYIVNKDENSNVNEFFILYTEDRKILINGKIEIGQTDFNSENDLIFKYLYDNKNKTIEKSEIKKMLRGHITKPFSKFLDNLGFVKGIRSTFINMNKTTIRLKSPVKL